MKYTKGFEILGLSNDFKFGIELEANNVNTQGKDGLYKGESAKYIQSKNWHMASKSEEKLVGRGGAELVSPILQDTKEDWESLSDICEHIKKFPGNKGNEVVTDENCGLHIHFDADPIAKNPNIMKNFLKLYAESEELIYKICNGKNDPIRKSAINKDFKGLNIINSIWRKGVASPTGKRILEQIENGTLKVSYKKFGKLKMLASKYKLDERRYSGLNLTNIGNSQKNTIEFRMSNGTLDFDTIKQNVFLYSSLLNTSIEMTNNPEIYEDNLKTFYNTNVTEQQKAENFLNLIMEDNDDKKIYMERWESVKDAPVFAKNDRKDFAKNRFKKEQFQKIAKRTPSEMVHNSYLYIKEMLSRTNEKGASIYDR